MAYPGTRTQKELYTTAKRVRDELGKGQETLRSFKAQFVAPADGAVPVRTVIGIPIVDIIVTEILMLAETQANTDLDVVVPIAFSTAPGAANRLIATIDSSAAVIADDIVSNRALLGLNGNRVVAFQPILAVATDDTVGAPTGTFYVEVYYILADEEVSY